MESQQVTVIKSTDENTISIPEHLMDALRLHEGDQVKTIVDGVTLRLASLSRFLALHGIFAEDEGFIEAMRSLGR
jgi:antitoxin component of MazEF toxin-antitoxin module